MASVVVERLSAGQGGATGHYPIADGHSGSVFANAHVAVCPRYSKPISLGDTNRRRNGRSFRLHLGLYRTAVRAGETSWELGLV